MTTTPAKETTPDIFNAAGEAEAPVLVICAHCDWRFALDSTPQAGSTIPPRCPHCYHPRLSQLSGEGAAGGALVPELVVPFEVAADLLQRRLLGFAEGIRFAPADLNAPNLTARLQRVFLPMWLVDTDVQANWEAEMGFDYEVVSHQARYGDHQGWDTREVKENRIRWEPRLGTLQRSYQNVRAPALEEHTQLGSALGAFDVDKAAADRPGSLADAVIRLPDRAQEDAWPAAALSVQAAASEECRQAAAASHIRGFRWSPEYRQGNWTQLLLPVYTTYYLDDEQVPQPILIHGQTGRLHGRRRASMARARRTAGLLLAIAVVIFLLSLITGGFSVLLPALVLPAGIGAFLGILLGLSAGIPILMVWQFNRSQKRKDG